MTTILLVLQVLLAAALIALILIQQGRGADTGASFGSGASTTVFGARGSASFLSRTTAVLAILFFSNSFLLAYLSTRTVQTKSLMEQVTAAPVATGTGAQEDRAPQPGSSDLPTVSPQPQAGGAESAPALEPGGAPAAGDVPAVRAETPADVPEVPAGDPAAPKN